MTNDSNLKQTDINKADNQTVDNNIDANTVNILPKHSKIEDTAAIITATFIIGFGLMIMKQANLLTGGTVGLALLVHYITSIKFGLLFFLFNIPFYVLAYLRLGMQMVIKTFIAVGLLSLMTELHPVFIQFDDIKPLYATILANTLFGVGLLILFRHQSSLGGFNLLSLFIQERYNIPAGKVQMALDVFVLLASFAFVPWLLLVFSIIGVIILNMILAVNHRPDRYIAKS